MKNINKLINEEINKYLNRHIFYLNEEEENDNDYESNRKADQYANTLKSLMDNGEMNLRKVVSHMTGIPTDTKDKSNVNKLNAATSAYRKKILGEPGSSGGKMHLDSEDISDFQNQLN